MSEDDRAAKAARAKALLKKRQQKKAADIAAVSSSGVVSSVSPPRTFSPPLSEPVEEDKNVRDLGDIFAKDTSDTSWLSSLPRIASPSLPPPPPAQVVPRVTASSPPAASVSSEHPSSPLPASTALQAKLESLSKENERLVSTLRRLEGFEAAAQQAQASFAAERKRVEELTENLQNLQDDTEIALQNERQTVSLLVTEKAHLTAELQKRADFESKVQDLEDELESERVKSKNHVSEVQRLQEVVSEALSRAEVSEAKEKEIADHYREQERQLQIISASSSELRKEADESQRKLRELEEQIQSDDRVERLESSLKHTQDRADELEFQLTKLKQAHTSLKSERDELEFKISGVSTKETEWTTQKSLLEESLAGTREKLSSSEKALDNSSQENARLQTVVRSHETSIEECKEKLAKAASALATITRQLQNAQNELKVANRRADDAEKTQKSLQGEGTNLMRALDEMRPKIVELTDTKLELAERVESLEHTIRSRDSVIVQLENDLEEARHLNGETEATWKERLAEQEKRHKEAQSGASDIQKAYREREEELDTALASLRNLEAQRANSHQEASRRLEEIELLKDQIQSQGEELDALRHEVDARRKAHDEEQDFLDRTQNEIEALRAELDARDDEIEHLREAVKSPSISDAPRSLDDEMLSSIRQQHAIEISAATSQIRALENTIFDKDTVNHKLQKQLNAAEERLAQLQSSSRRPFSPVPARPASRALENDLRRSSFGSHRPNPAPLSRTVFDHNISPETMHKRKVSLSMLKARIDSEVKTTTHSQPPSRALSPVQSESGSRRSSILGPHHHIHRPQFLDESHVFWCHSCHDDLVIL